MVPPRTTRSRLPRCGAPARPVDHGPGAVVSGDGAGFAVRADACRGDVVSGDLHIDANDKVWLYGCETGGAIDKIPVFIPAFASNRVETVAALLRAGLAAEQAPEGLSVGPVVDGRQTYWCWSHDLPTGWESILDDDDQWGSYKTAPLGGFILQCRAPLPAPATEKVRLDQIIGRTLPCEVEPVVNVGPQAPGHWSWTAQRYLGDGRVWHRLPIDTDGLVEVLTEEGAS